MSEVRKLTAEGRATPLKDVPAPIGTPLPETPAGVPQAPQRSRWKRRLLLFGVPALVMLAAGYLYVQGGRYVGTNNAYVKADKAIVTAQVSGKIASVAVTENQRVEPGDTLFSLDPAPFQVALNRADAALAQTRNDVGAAKVAYQQALAEIELAQTNVEYAKITHTRQVGLVGRQIGAVSDLDDARHGLETALKQVQLAQQRAAKILIDLHGNPNIPIESHPRFLQAAADRDQAVLDLDHSVIKAPFAGIASKKPEIGTYVERGMPVMSLVADRNMWIEANFKETDLTYLRPDQAATIHVDTYPGLEWQGTVQSISEATGSEFAVLPAQNATGNWVKVVQRIAVRITIAQHDGDPPLRSGMSANVTVDTGHHRSAGELLPHWGN
jgi:membrane fusion protein, multidrug efflux system